MFGQTWIGTLRGGGFAVGYCRVDAAAKRKRLGGGTFFDVDAAAKRWTLGGGALRNRGKRGGFVARQAQFHPRWAIAFHSIRSIQPALSVYLAESSNSLGLDGR